jgi:hypothetical protein
MTKTQINYYMNRTAVILSVILTVMTFTVFGQRNEKSKADSLVTSGLVNGLKFRSIGPAWASGRIADFAVNP